MITNLQEGTKKKCHQYWPEFGVQSFGPFQVTITDQQILADYTTRCFSVQVYNYCVEIIIIIFQTQLIGSSEQVLDVTQFHFTAWPVYGVPDYATSLLAFHKNIKKHHRPSMGPLLVHCRYITFVYVFNDPNKLF